MAGLTLNLDVAGRQALLVGGGSVAARKAAALLEAGMILTIVTPVAGELLSSLASKGDVRLILRPYRSEDLDGAFLVIAATGQREVNRRVAADARRLGLLVNVADAPEEGNCCFSALLRRGALEIAVATGGASPGFAAAVRDELAGVIDVFYGEALALLAQQREKLLTMGQGETYNTQLIKKALAGGLLDLLRQGNRAAAETLIRQCCSEADRLPVPDH